jgi:hypothetical protein
MPAPSPSSSDETSNAFGLIKSPTWLQRTFLAIVGLGQLFIAFVIAILPHSNGVPTWWLGIPVLALGWFAATSLPKRFLSRAAAVLTIATFGFYG